MFTQWLATLNNLRKDDEFQAFGTSFLKCRNGDWRDIATDKRISARQFAAWLAAGERK